MAVTKSISDFNEVSTEENEDLYLLQRGSSYFKIKRKNLAGGMVKISAVLSTSQLEALFTSPIELIPAQGANTYIQIVSANAFRNGTAFTATDAQLKLVFTGQTQAHFRTNTVFLTAVAAKIATLMGLDTSGLPIFENTGISAYLTQDVTTATGPVTIEIIYRVATFT